MKKIFSLIGLLFLTTIIYSQIDFNVKLFDFGQVTVNNPVKQEFPMTSAIVQSVNLSGLSGPFSVEPTSISYQSVNTTQKIFINFKPVNTGTFRDTLIVKGSIWGTQTLIVTGSGTKVKISTSSNDISFGTVALVGTQTQTLTISNSGSGSLVVNNITASNLNLSFSPTSFTIPQGQSQLLTVSFTPSSAGKWNGSFSIYSNDPATPVKEITCSATCIANISGNVSGTWLAENSPYYIVGNTTVPKGQSLTIQPGVNIVFEGNSKLMIAGSVTLVGSDQDSIVFSRGTGERKVSEKTSNKKSSTTKQQQTQNQNVNQSQTQTSVQTQTTVQPPVKTSTSFVYTKGMINVISIDNLMTNNYREVKQKCKEKGISETDFDNVMPGFVKIVNENPRLYGVVKDVDFLSDLIISYYNGTKSINN